MALSCSTMKPTDSFECQRVEMSELEKTTLRRVCDDISLDIFLVAVVELAERFTYRSITAPMREFYQQCGGANMLTGIENYVQHGRDDVLRHGALGLVIIIVPLLLCK